MKRLILFFCICSGLAQHKKTTKIDYRKIELQEKNIVRLTKDKDSLTTYLFLSKPKVLQIEIEDYFSPYLASFSKPNLTVIKKDEDYYFLFQTKKYTIISFAHLIYHPRIDCNFLILGSNHCLISNSLPLCYPSTDGTTCKNRQPHCTKINSKKN